MFFRAEMILERIAKVFEKRCWKHAKFPLKVQADMVHAFKLNTAETALKPHWIIFLYLLLCCNSSDKLLKQANHPEYCVKMEKNNEMELQLKYLQLGYRYSVVYCNGRNNYRISLMPKKDQEWATTLHLFAEPSDVAE